MMKEHHERFQRWVEICGVTFDDLEFRTPFVRAVILSDVFAGNRAQLG
jgi:hypothetical protein